MPLNPVFNFHDNHLEQALYEDLIIESIQIYGYDMMYIPRRIGSYNNTLNEDGASYYNASYPVEMYIKSFEGFTGDATFLSKFNVEVRNELTLTLAKRRYAQIVGGPEDSTRPKEGDLIWYAKDKTLFMIKKVEQYNVFYRQGQLQTWDLFCEPFEYSGEHFDTGIAAVDALEEKWSLNTSSGALLLENGAMLVDEDNFPIIVDFDLEEQQNDHFSDTFEINEVAEDIIDFSEDNPFSERF